MPARGERPSLGFAVADDAAGDQMRAVKLGAVGVQLGIAELAAFVDRARGLGRAVARHAARKRELGEQPLRPGFVLRDVLVDLAVRPFEPGVGEDPQRPVAGPVTVMTSRPRSLMTRFK
jgi:hypothetical protein